MASYNELLALIDAYINQNGVQAITGQVLNGVLRAMVDQLGRGYSIMGAADPTTDPGTPDGPESWFASVPGTYTNFDGIQIADGELALLSYTPSDGFAKNTLYDGFQEVTAQIDGNVGTPAVGVSYANGILSFDFHNMKGETGDPAGFGSVSATIDDNIGTPSVSVAASGPDTARNFAFNFRNLKGETGVTSVLATVDNTSGNPQCAVSLQGQQLTLAFTGLKGAQGDTGSSIDYPFTIVNNLTTNDATQALSAAMGVQLESEVSQLEAEVNEKADQADLSQLQQKMTELVGGEITPELTWVDGFVYNTDQQSTNDSYQKTQKFELKKGQTVTFVGGKDTAAITIHAVAVYVNNIFDYSKSVKYSDTTATTITYTATEDVEVILSTKKTMYGGSVSIVVDSRINTIEEVNEAQQENLAAQSNEVFGAFNDLNIVGGILNSSNVLDASGTSYCVPIEGGKSFKIAGNYNNYCIYAFLTTLPVVGSVVSYATGSSRTLITYRTEVSGTAPANAKYLLLSRTSGNSDWSPMSATYDSFPISLSLRNAIKQEIAAVEDDISALADSLCRTEITLNKTNGKYIGYDGLGGLIIKDTANSFCVSDVFQLNSGETLYIRCTPPGNYPIAATCKQDGTLITPAIWKNGNGVYHFTADDDCLLCVSYDYSSPVEMWKESFLPEHYKENDVAFDNLEERFYDYSAQEYKPGNGVWKSKTFDVSEVEIIRFSTELPSSVSSNVALITYLGSDDSFIDAVLKLNETSATGRYSNYCYVPKAAKKAVIQNLTTAISIETTVHFYSKKTDGYAREQEFDTMREMVYNHATGLARVGQMVFTNTVSSPEVIDHSQPAVRAPYFDANSSFKQYKKVDEQRYIADGCLDGLIGEELNFVPEAGYLRCIVGKGEDDTFYVSFFPSDYGSADAGDSNRVLLQKTTDFVNFTTILKGYDNTDDSGLSIANIHLWRIDIVKECADGSLIIGASYRNDNEPSTDGSGNTNNNGHFGLIRINPTGETAALCTGTDINGNNSNVVGSHGIPNGGTAYTVSSAYDWHLQTYGGRVLAGEYGSRSSAFDDWGRVWYSEDCGVTFKEVFQVRNHLNEGVAEGQTVTGAHMHGVMIDPYSNNIFVIVGEDNRNLFYTDKGMNATDNDWNVIPIREQFVRQGMTYMQVVNGYPFKDRIIFGSDVSGIGALFAINRLADGSFSMIETAHEILPFNFAGTTYCAGAQSRRDLNSPALLCMTRENFALTEADNDLLMQQHLGRVVATWDGVSFFEIWHDNTYGTHTVKVNGTITTKNIAYCTRGMQAWLLINGDLIIKYAGRNYAYLGGNTYIPGYGDFSARCYRIKNAERFLVIK